MPQWRRLHVQTTESFDLDDMPDDFTRLLWVMLPLGLDREGRGPDNASWVKSKVMPLRTDVTPEQVEAALTWYAERGLIQRYVVEGRRYFWASSFREQQGNTLKEAPSRISPPPAAGPATCGALDSGASPDQDPTDSEPIPDPVQTDSRSGPITDVDTDLDSDTDADADEDAGAGAPASAPSSEEPEGNTAEEKPKLTPGQRQFLELLDAQRNQDRTQAEVAQALERARGITRLVDAPYPSEAPGHFNSVLMRP